MSKRSSRAKVKRNDPCVCGSGKKHKKCCLHKKAAAEALEREARAASQPEAASGSSCACC